MINYDKVHHLSLCKGKNKALNRKLSPNLKLFEKLKQLEDSGFIVEKEKTDLSTLVGHPILIVRKKTM